MKIRNVLSLFDGISCGRVALKRAGILIEKYYSSEIDKYAIQISNKNFQDISQLGDIRNWRNWNIDFSSIDLLLAGFPCQSWSMAGKQKGDSDPRGALVHDLIDIWNEVKKYNPNVKFLFENVRMKKEFIDYINTLFGVEPICINSSLVSAQNRVRYYWSNIEGIYQPKDKGILLKDILEDNSNKVGRIVGRRINPKTGKRDDYNKDIPIIQRVEPRMDNKCGCLTTVQKDNVVITNDGNTRKLTVLEYERLQTLPDYFTIILDDKGKQIVSNSQIFKAIGNAWTVDVIVQCFKELKGE